VAKNQNPNLFDDFDDNVHKLNNKNQDHGALNSIELLPTLSNTTIIQSILRSQTCQGGGMAVDNNT
jgi:hypothetical protein